MAPHITLVYSTQKKKLVLHTINSSLAKVPKKSPTHWIIRLRFPSPPPHLLFSRISTIVAVAVVCHHHRHYQHAPFATKRSHRIKQDVHGNLENRITNDPIKIDWFIPITPVMRPRRILLHTCRVSAVVFVRAHSVQGWSPTRVGCALQRLVWRGLPESNDPNPNEAPIWIPALCF